MKNPLATTYSKLKTRETSLVNLQIIVLSFSQVHSKREVFLANVF